VRLRLRRSSKPLRRTSEGLRGWAQLYANASEGLPTAHMPAHQVRPSLGAERVGGRLLRRAHMLPEMCEGKGKVLNRGRATATVGRFMGRFIMTGVGVTGPG